MSAEITNESGRRAFYRFGLSGVFFTILGPVLFRLAYPLGPFVAFAMAELLTHAVRFITFQRFVFPAKKNYQVNLRRYVVSALPTSILGLLIVILLRNVLDRTMLTLSGTVIAVGVGFVWSRFIYKQPLVRR